MTWDKIVIALWVVVGAATWLGIFAASGWTIQGFTIACLALAGINVVVSIIFMIAASINLSRLR